MPSTNPFTPSFGGKPQHFFGRAEQIGRVERALADDNSPDRVLFFTGNRGCGKTALLERLSGAAAEQRWLVCDVHSSHAVDALALQLAWGSRISASVAPRVSLPGGIEVSVGSASAESASAGGFVDLTSALIAACENLGTKRGVFITIDEIQKISEADMEQVCAAVQMARRKGHPVMLMLAGLPHSKETVASYPGCTFMQRVDDVRLGSLKVSETFDAFKGLFGLVPEIEVSDEALRAIAEFTQGYPYLIQLAGYYLIEHLHDRYPVGVVRASAADVAEIEEPAYAKYRDNVLAPSLRNLRQEGRSYLAAMAPLLDDHAQAATADIAEALGKTQTQLSSCRQNLIDRRLIAPGGRGTVGYALPHLSRYVLEAPTEDRAAETDTWEMR